MKVPFFKPHLTGSEVGYVRQAIKSLQWSGEGPFTKRCVAFLENLTDVKVMLTPSGSSALDLAIMTMDFEPGDEVILPSFTFPSTANCVVNAGLKPVFVDIRPDTLNIDENLIEPAISPKTRAIMPVHYAGVAANMEVIRQIAKKHSLKIIEDAAHGVNAFYQNKALGSLGDLGIYSFHSSKNFSSGEGGALLVGDPSLAERADILRQKGTNRSRFLRGEVDKYSWVERGSNYMLSDILAAFLFAQLQQMEEITQRRKALYEKYIEELSPVSQGRFRLPVIPACCQSNYHLFFIQLDSNQVRQDLMTWLTQNGLGSATHFVPLHSSEAGRRYGVVRSKMNVTESAGSCLLRLPLFPQMQNEEIDHVIDCLKSFFERNSSP